MKKTLFVSLVLLFLLTMVGFVNTAKAQEDNNCTGLLDLVSQAVLVENTSLLYPGDVYPLWGDVVPENEIHLVRNENGSAVWGYVLMDDGCYKQIIFSIETSPHYTLSVPYSEWS